MILPNRKHRSNAINRRFRSVDSSSTNSSSSGRTSQSSSTATSSSGASSTNRSNDYNAFKARNLKNVRAFVNLNDDQTVFKLVMDALHRLDSGVGVTAKEICRYMRKRYKILDDDEKLFQIVKDSLNQGISYGCLRRRFLYCGRCPLRFPINLKMNASKEKPMSVLEKAALKRKSKRLEQLKSRKKCERGNPKKVGLKKMRSGQNSKSPPKRNVKHRR